MPDLDVSEAFIGFTEMIRVERRTEIIDVHGMRSGPSTFFDNVAAVVTATPSPLVREPEQQHMESSILVHTKFRLRGPNPGNWPDVVWWHGDPYVVENLKDWSNFGSGYMRAECSGMNKLDSPPPEETT